MARKKSMEGMSVFESGLFEYKGKSSSDKSKNKKNVEVFRTWIDKELETTFPVGMEGVDCLDVLEGQGAMLWHLCNHKYKQLPSSYHKDTTKYNLNLLNFLQESGTVILRKVYDNNDLPEVAYIFEYNSYFITFTVTFDSDHENPFINGFSAYHPININPDFNVFSKFEIKPKNTPKIGIIKSNRYGPYVSWMEHNTNLEFKYDYYNDDFSVFFGDLKEKLKENKTGLYLLYGEAGTGKSSTIRHLITQTDRPVVFIPPQMISCLSSPDFTDLVTSSLKNCILVIEDAEKALMKRESQDGFFNSELVSSILNLTDGLYADLANTSIIATYNCDRSLIDPALLRKGRLRSEYHFRKLSVDKAKKLMKDLGHEGTVNEEMSLADIFNFDKQYTNDVKEKKRAVGFGG